MSLYYMTKLKQHFRKHVWRYVFAFTAVAYLCAMVVYPVVENDFDWAEIQQVRGRWQALNVGVLALGASYLALSISSKTLEANDRQYHERLKHDEEKRKHRLLSAKAFLPVGLGELCDQLRRSGRILERTLQADPKRRPPFKLEELPEVLRPVI